MMLTEEKHLNFKHGVRQTLGTLLKVLPAGAKGGNDIELRKSTTNGPTQQLRKSTTNGPTQQIKGMEVESTPGGPAQQLMRILRTMGFEKAYAFVARG
eukprot:6900992-Heterocapsa_arctica.AAC.1